MGNTSCGTAELVPLPITISTNIIRLYFKSIVGMQCQVISRKVIENAHFNNSWTQLEILGNYIDQGDVIHNDIAEYKSKFLSDVKSVHTLPPCYVTAIRVRVRVIKGDLVFQCYWTVLLEVNRVSYLGGSCLLNGFKLYCQCIERKMLTKFKLIQGVAVNMRIMY